MEEQGELFTLKHKRLLTIAFWAKYLAWVVLVFHVIRGGIYIPSYQISLLGAQSLADPSGLQTLFSYLKENPYYLASLVSSMLSVFLSGAIYFLVLQSVSLGLSMIVETDINYREKVIQGEEQ